MESRQLLQVLTACGVVMAASCGGGGGGSPAPSPAPAPAPAPAPSPAPAPADTTPPNTQFNSVPEPRNRSLTATFIAMSDEVGTTFEASLDGGPYTTVPDIFTLNNLAEGAHTVSVRARDAANNVDATPATTSWYTDLSAPAARIMFPTPISYSNATQLHVRGTAQDAAAGTVASVTVNGVAASTSDGYAHWAATVPIAIGDNSLVVSTTDSTGNVGASAARAAVTNRGTMLHYVQHMAYDAAGQRVLLADSELRAVVAIRTSDQFASIVSDGTHGAGPSLQQPWGLTLDGSRALVTDTSADALIAIDLTTGNRTVLSASPSDFALRVGGAVAYDATTQRAYVATFSSVLCIDLANGGTRTVFSSGTVGSGVPFDGYSGIVLDTTAGTPRLLVSGGHAVVAVDITTGNRSYLSYAAPLDLPNAVGAGPAFYGIGQLFVDAANHRLLVADVGPNSFAGRLTSISLSNGDRTILTPGTNEIPLNNVLGLAVDATRGRAYIASTDRARIAQYDLANAVLARFHDSNVGFGPALAATPGILLSSASGTANLYVARQDQNHLVMRVNPATGERATVSIFGNTGTGPQWADTVGRLVADTRPGASHQALALDYAYNTDTLSLRGLDLVSGDRSIIASALLPATRLQSNMALDVEANRVVVGLNVAGNQGPSNVAAMDLTTGVVTDVASLSVGNGPPMYEIGAVAVLPGTFPVPAAGRILVGTSAMLLRVDGSGNRTQIAGNGPSLLRIQDMAVDLAQRRILVGSSYHGALQWVDLDSGDRSMVSGPDPDTQATRGEGPPLLGYPFAMELDVESGLAYASVMQNALMAVDLLSGDRVVISR